MIHHFRSFSVLLLSTLLISCGGGRSTDSQNDGGENPPAGKISDHVFELDFGKTAVLASENLTVTFESVIQDSRCPADAYCVWEGVAIIGLRVIAAPADTHFVALSLSDWCTYGCNPPYPPVRDTLGYRFWFLALEPYPISTVQFPDADYKATLAVFPYPPMDSVEGEVIISDQHPAAIQDARFVLDSVRIEGDILTLTIEYGGGCNEHEFELHMSPAAFMESFPAQTNLYLRHEDFDDPCDAWIRQSVSFDLRPIAHLYEIGYHRLDCIVLHVHDFIDGSDPARKTSVIYHLKGKSRHPRAVLRSCDPCSHRVAEFEEE